MITVEPLKDTLPVVRTITRSFTARDLVGGHCAIDLVNTVNARNSDDPMEWLDGFERLVEWALLASLLSQAQSDALLRLASKSPSRSRAALARARKLREALHAVFTALIDGGPIPGADLEHIDTARLMATRRTRLAMEKGVLEPKLSVERSGFDLIGDAIALAAVELLAELPHDRARVCPGGDCGWLFLDTSKGGQRVWCDMASCGNAAKSRRFLKRQSRRSKRN